MNERMNEQPTYRESSPALSKPHDIPVYACGLVYVCESNERAFSQSVSQSLIPFRVLGRKEGRKEGRIIGMFRRCLSYCMI